MKPVKWGILSTAKIGVEKVIPGMMKSKNIEIVAIASREKKRAVAAAKKLGVSRRTLHRKLHTYQLEAL